LDELGEIGELKLGELEELKDELDKKNGLDEIVIIVPKKRKRKAQIKTQK
jgi:hypothetical protein